MDWKTTVLLILVLFVIVEGWMIFHFWRKAKILKESLLKLNIDPLTRLKNRTAFFEWRDAVSQQQRTERREAETRLGNWKLVFIDLNKFKQVNDKLGHHTGDLALRLTAVFFTTHFRRSEDLVIRWGGDEFLIVTRSPNVAERLEKAQKIFIPGLVKKSLPQVTEKGIPFSFSYGVEELPLRPTEEDIDSALRMIDTKMYYQKQRG